MSDYGDFKVVINGGIEGALDPHDQCGQRIDYGVLEILADGSDDGGRFDGGGAPYISLVFPDFGMWLHIDVSVVKSLIGAIESAANWAVETDVKRAARTEEQHSD